MPRRDPWAFLDENKPTQAAEPPEGRMDRTTKTVAGIDPGLEGGIAILHPGGVDARVTPILGSGRPEFDMPGMLAVLRSRPIDLVVIERVASMPKQGVVSTFKFGAGFGLWLGMLAALEIPYELVLPQAWKKQVLAGTPKDKQAAIQFAQRRFPGVSLLATPRCRTPHTGMADALCLAEYGRRLLGNK